MHACQTHDLTTHLKEIFSSHKLHPPPDQKTKKKATLNKKAKRRKLGALLYLLVYIPKVQLQIKMQNLKSKKYLLVVKPSLVRKTKGLQLQPIQCDLTSLQGVNKNIGIQNLLFIYLFDFWF